MSKGHEFEMDEQRVDNWRCVHKGCTVRKSAAGQFWQERTGGRWNDVDKAPMPPCGGMTAQHKEKSMDEVTRNVVNAAQAIINHVGEHRLARNYNLTSIEVPGDLLRTLAASIKGQPNSPCSGA